MRVDAAVAPSIRDRVVEVRSQLAGAGLPPAEADVDARLLAQHALGWDAARFFTHDLDLAPPGFAVRYRALAERRARREPLAYILGRREFWRLSLEVSSAVLIPRPESELIVEAALERCAEGQPLTIADLCTGSGCLAIALATERPQATVTATDISEAALELARRNAAALGVADRVLFYRADLLEGLAGPFDLILANPPYVPEIDREGLAPEVRDYEPAVALFAGSDGLDCIRKLVAGSPSRLAARGLLVFEFGFGQADAVCTLVAGTRGLVLEAIERDLQGIPRVAIARNAGPKPDL